MPKKYLTNCWRCSIRVAAVAVCRLESGGGGGKDASDESTTIANGATGSFDAKQGLPTTV